MPALRFWREGEKFMDISVVNLEEKFAKFEEQLSPKIIAQMNNYHFKLVKSQGEFIWHKHPETDEVFMIIEGNFQIHLRDKVLQLKKGEMVVIPKGVEHKSLAKEECKVLLIEPEGTLNTGDAGGDLTVTELEWI
jgi:mannose-6-phosphate isomerase-like protein (cupin superfamily)